MRHVCTIAACQQRHITCKNKYVHFFGTYTTCTKKNVHVHVCILYFAWHSKYNVAGYTVCWTFDLLHEFKC